MGGPAPHADLLSTYLHTTALHRFYEKKKRAVKPETNLSATKSETNYAEKMLDLRAVTRTLCLL